jgi:predicted O-linked N-acetylglucosamine transferase (SPINDLY family)
MDLGNLFFTLGISTKDFDKKMEAEIEKAKLLKTELQNILKGTKLGVTKENAEAAKLMAEANRENAAAAKLAAQAEREKVKVALEALKLKQKEEELQNGVTAAVQRTKEAQAQNARLILSSNGHLSITKRLLGEMGTAASMYFSIFTAQHLLESLIRIRGEFDMQYISLKAILQSGEQATKLFEQIKGLAVVSPFKFMDLTTYAKQLSAYQIPTNELFNTTKRLADLSSGLGVGYEIVLFLHTDR